MPKKKPTRKRNRRASSLPILTFGWCRPPELRAVLDTLREGFERRGDKVGLRHLSALFQWVEAVGMESELTLGWVKRRTQQRRQEREREQKRFEKENRLLLEGMMDPDRMAERAVQAMLWTEIQRALPETSGAPAWERFEVRGEDGTPQRLLPQGSDELRRLAAKVWLFKDALANYFRAQSPLDRMEFLYNLFQTPPPITLLINLRGRKPQRMPPLQGRQAQYAEVRKQARELSQRHEDADLGEPEVLQEVRREFPDLFDIRAIDLPPLRSAAFAHLVLSKRWGVTPSTVKTRLKR